MYERWKLLDNAISVVYGGGRRMAKVMRFSARQIKGAPRNATIKKFNIERIGKQLSSLFLCHYFLCQTNL